MLGTPLLAEAREVKISVSLGQKNDHWESDRRRELEEYREDFPLVNAMPGDEGVVPSDSYTYVCVKVGCPYLRICGVWHQIQSEHHITLAYAAWQDAMVRWQLRNDLDRCLSRWKQFIGSSAVRLRYDRAGSITRWDN